MHLLNISRGIACEVSSELNAKIQVENWNKRTGYGEQKIALWPEIGNLEIPIRYYNYRTNQFEVEKS